jgi:predicted enzyme related to lactoylglutathione lyase
MSNADIRGQFVWHELMTTDTKGAAAFYPKVTGWKTESWEKDPNYTLWAGAKGPFGGLRALPEAARAAGSHWLPYIGTPSVLATMEAAHTLGGRVLMGATDIPGGGRFAVLADPQGAQFAVYRAAAATAGGGSGSMPQEFSWHELATTDPVAALKFYSTLFGWAEVRAHDMGHMGVYHLVGLGGVESIGMFKISADRPQPPNWLCYAQITDIDKAANAGKSAGGKLLNGPMEVPGGTWIAQLTDPQGAPFALHALKRVAVATPAAQPPKVVAPKNVSTAAAPKPQPPTVKPATPAAPAPAAAAKPQAPAAVSAQAKKPPAAALKPVAKSAPPKKAAKKKAPKKKAAAKKSSAKKRPKPKSKTKAKKAQRKSSAKKKVVKKRGKSAKRRVARGSFAAARLFAAKEARSILKRLRGKKHR